MADKELLDQNREIFLELPEQREFKRDFDGQLYLWEETDVSYKQVVKHVERYVMEKLMKPTQQTMWVGYQGELDPEYEKRMQNGITYWRERGDAEAVHQFQMELVGMRNMSRLVAKSKAEKGFFPSIVDASHPGDFYKDENGFRKIVTNVGVGGEEVEDGYLYTYYTIPSDFLELEVYYEYVSELGLIQLTEELLQQRMGELSSTTLVAFPFLVEQYQNLASKLGYSSWDEITQLADEYLEDKEDLFAYERRSYLVKNFADRYWEGIILRDEELIEDVTDAMGVLLAMEYGNKYLGKDKEFMAGEIDRMVRLAKAQRLKVFETPALLYESSGFSPVEFTNLGNLNDLYAYRQQMMIIMQTDRKVQEGMATGCGGAVNFLQGRGLEMLWPNNQSVNLAGFDLHQNYGYTSNISNGVEYISTTSSSTTWINGEPEGTKDKMECVECPLCHHKPVTAYMTSSRIYCSSCKDSLPLSSVSD